MPFSRISLLFLFGNFGTNRSNKENREYIELALAVIDNVELRGVLAFARHAGLRVPSEIRHLEFS